MTDIFGIAAIGIAGGAKKAAAEAVAKHADAAFVAVMDDTNTTEIFRKWWDLNSDNEPNKYTRLSRFFGMLAMGNDQTHTVRFYAAEASSGDAGTPLDWLANKSPAPLATDTDDPGAGWDEENRLTWYIRANALSLADGTMNVLHIEGESGFDITGEIAPVYTFQMAPWFRESVDENYELRSWRATYAPGYRPYAWDVAPDNAKRTMTWHPTFGGGLTADGKLTSGVGKHAANYMSATAGLTAAQKWNPYEGLWSDCDTKWALYEWQHRHFTKEPSGILEGCLNYSYQYAVALPEVDVKRVLLTSAQAANLIVGSAVIVGDKDVNESLDRSNAYMCNLSDTSVNILSIAPVTVGETEYTAVELDLQSTITTTATTYVSTMPWMSGATEVLPGHRDGSPGSLTDGKYPCRIAGVEMLRGAYDIGLDPLYQVTANADGGFDYAVYECRDSENLSGSITANYTFTGIVIQGIINGWQYVKSFVTTYLGILFPNLFGGSSTTYYKSAFCGTPSAGVRCPWRFGHLYNGANGGLGGETGGNAPSASAWSGSSRLTGAGKKRGEWTA